MPPASWPVFHRRHTSLLSFRTYIGCPSDSVLFYKVMCLTYGTLNSTAPIYLSDLVARRQHSRTLLSSVDSSLLTVSRTKKEYPDRAFSAWGPRHWNSLPQKFATAQTVRLLKRHSKHSILFNTFSPSDSTSVWNFWFRPMGLLSKQFSV